MGPRQPHQLPGGVVGVGQPPQDGCDLVVGDLVGQPVTAQEQAVPGVGEDLPHVRLDLGTHPQHAGEDVALGMDGGLVQAEPSFPHEVLHQAVILGEAAQLALLEQIGARVADVDDDQPVLAVHLDEGDRGQGGAHAPQVGIVLSAVPNGPIGLLDRGDQTFRGAIALEVHPQSLDRREGRHLAAAVATHAVSHGEQRFGYDEVVLVVAANPAGVGGRPEAESRHATLTSRAPAPCAPPAPGPRVATRGAPRPAWR